MEDDTKKTGDLFAIVEAAKAKQPSTLKGVTKPTNENKLQEIQASLWGDEQRGVPNEVVRSALFNARNKNQKRVYLKDVDIAVIGEGRITFRGEELRQDDETVWLQLVHMFKGMHPDSVIEFTPYSFCKAVRWPVKGQSYKRLVECLSRLQATSLKIYSARLKKGTSLSMLPKFDWEDPATGKALPKYRVVMSPELAKLYADMHYTKLDWEQRLRLPVGVATWLHGYYASHSKPFPVKVETLAKGAGLTTSDPYRLQEIITNGLDELKAVGFLNDWQLVGDLVHVQRNPDY